MTEFWDRRAKQLLVISGIVLLLFACLKFTKYFADILIVVGISILISYLLIGPVDFLTKIVRFRAIAVMLTYLALFSLLITGFIFISPKVTKEFGEFTRQIPAIRIHLDQKIHNIQTYLNKNNIPVNLTTATSGLTKRFSNLTLDPIGNILGVAKNTFHIVFYIFVTAVTSYYFLLDGHNIIKELTKHIPDKYQHHIHNLVSELDKCLRGFYGAMVKLAAINATVMFISYVVLNLPYALLLALWHFISFIIPVVGGWIGLVPALLVIAFTAPYKIWIPIVVYEGFTRLIQDNLITPRIMGDAIGMHPVLVLIAILAGLKTAGLIGILFALPIFGVLNVIFKYSLEQLGESNEN
ncbi:MAG: AI-2E family transporter [Candidatus Melainabacteria bacterium]|nr:AI-2E family transporter [Candidatus Melainabacteria bacterium]